MKATILLLLSFIALLYVAFESGRHIEADKKSTHTSLPKQMPSESSAIAVEQYTDSQGHKHNVFMNQESQRVIKKRTVSLLPYIDSVALALNIKSKQLEAESTVSTVTHEDSVKFLRIQVDSLKRLVYYYDDKYLKLIVRMGAKDSTLDTANFDFSYNDSLRIDQYWKRKKLLGLNIGSKQHFTDISSSDPRTTIAGLKTLTVKQNLPTVGFKLQAVLNYSLLNTSLSPGLGFRFDANRVSLNGTYYYNTDLNQWRPVLALRYDIIQF
jgi:hypothetical protein